MQTAKQRFSELVRAAETGEAQFITRHGEPVAVVIDIAEYRRTHDALPSLGAFLLTAPTVDGGLPLPERSAEPDRSLDIFADPA